MAEIIWCLYTADDGTTYRVRRTRTAVALYPITWGFVADDTSRPQLPKILKMRYTIAVRDADGTNPRKEAVGNTTCQVWVERNPGDLTYGLTQGDGTIAIYRSTGWQSEKYRKY